VQHLPHAARRRLRFNLVGALGEVAASALLTTTPMAVEAHTSSDTDLATPHLLVAGPYGASDLEVLLFKGRESVNDLYRYDITLRFAPSPDGEVIEELLRAPARLMTQWREGFRSIEGIATELHLDGVHPRGGAHLRMRLEPRMARLRLAKTSRVFQDMTVRQIVDDVLDRHHIRRSWRLSRADYPVRAYCTQYQESDYELVARLLAEEGIFFFFEQPSACAGDALAAPMAEDASVETLVIADHVAAYPDIRGGPVLRANTLDWERGEDTLATFSFRRRALAESLVLREYDFRHPSYPVTAQAVPWELLGDPTPTQIYEHHSQYELPEAQRDMSSTHLEQHRVKAARGWGVSDCRRLVPGHAFAVQDFAQSHLDGRYAIISTKVNGHAPFICLNEPELPEFIATVECVPAHVACRPPRPERPPRQVVETAVVVGPQGEEIHTDEYGRVEVRFHWDLEHKSTCFLRVAQPWAGSGFGFQFVPRVGMEVLVSFIGGDLDNPVVIGALPNAHNRLPFPPPAYKTMSGIRSRSTPRSVGYSEISFEDRAGSEVLNIRAQRDLTESVGGSARRDVRGDLTATIGGHSCESIAGDRRLEVNGGETTRVHEDEVHWTGGSRMDTVTRSYARTVYQDMCAEVWGREERSIGGDSRLELDGRREERIRGGATTVVAGDGEQVSQLHVEGVAQTFASKLVQLEALGGITLTCGASTLRILPSRIELVAPEIHLNGPGAHLALREGRVEIDAKELAQISAETTVARSASARLRLDRDARIQGEHVRLEGPPGPGAPPPEEPRRLTHIELRDQGGNPLAHRHYTVLSGDTPVGGGLVGKDGTDAILLESGDTIVFPGLGELHGA
jgi:type VI secretion system secreted protein VgrG